MYVPKVLLVEDNEAELEVMLFRLARLPVVFLIAVDGRQAFDVLQHIKLDLVVTDGTYPDSEMFIPLVCRRVPTILFGQQ